MPPEFTVINHQAIAFFGAVYICIELSADYEVDGHSGLPKEGL